MLCLVLVAAGCSGSYGHKPLSAGSAEHARIGHLLAALRQAGPAGLAGVVAGDAAPGLDEPARRRLAGALAPLAEADRVELLKVDRFGPDICRATFQATRGDSVRTVSILLMGPSSQLRWLQPN